MNEKNEIRLKRYGIGILFLFVGLISIMIAVFLNKSTEVFVNFFGILFYVFGMALLIWSAILIGRCEEFIKNKEYLGEKENEWYMEVSYFSSRDSGIFFNLGFNYWKDWKE